MSIAIPHLLALAQAAAQQVSTTGDSKYIIYGLIALAAAMVIFLAELFVPSGGLLGVASVCSLVLGIVFLSLYSTTLGLVAGIIALIAAPFFFGIAVRLWPQSPIGRLLTHHDAQAPLTRAAKGVEDVDDAGDPADSNDKQLVGHSGRAVTDLRPIGTCLIDGKRTECLAEGGMIRAGSNVKVVSVDGMQVKVRAVED